MAKFNFNLRNASDDKETPVNLIVRWSNNRLVYPTLLTIHPKYWDKDQQIVKTTMKFPNSPEFNISLGNFKTKASKAFLDFINDNTRLPEINELRDSLDKVFERNRPPQVKKLDLYGFIEKFIEEAKSRVNAKTGKLFAQGTINSYNQCLMVLREFDKKKKLDFDSIDLDFFHSFKLFLSDRELKPNTIAKHFKKLKTFLNDASERGINTNMTYKSKRFVVPEVLVETIYLNEKELEELTKLDLSGNEKLQRVRDSFVIQCWTGLRWGDFISLSKDHFKNNLITIRTEKTDETVVIPLYPVVKEIMARYKDKTPNSLPIPYSEGMMNRSLKELGQLVESLKETIRIKTVIKAKEVNKDFYRYELLTTHTARRSFATNLYLDGFPSITIRKITGHKTEQAFMRYIRVTPTEHAILLQAHWNNKKNLIAID